MLVHYAKNEKKSNEAFLLILLILEGEAMQLIVNADDFDNDECFDIQEQADHYFDDRYVDDISDYGSYAGRKYMVDFEKGELSDEICLELSVTQL